VGTWVEQLLKDYIVATKYQSPSPAFIEAAEIHSYDLIGFFDEPIQQWNCKKGKTKFSIAEKKI
jgi:hypothetical protein